MKSTRFLPLLLLSASFVMASCGGSSVSSSIEEKTDSSVDSPVDTPVDEDSSVDSPVDTPVDEDSSVESSEEEQKTPDRLDLGNSLMTAGKNIAGAEKIGFKETGKVDLGLDLTLAGYAYKEESFTLEEPMTFENTLTVEEEAEAALVIKALPSGYAEFEASANVDGKVNADLSIPNSIKGDVQSHDIVLNDVAFGADAYSDGESLYFDSTELEDVVEKINDTILHLSAIFEDPAAILDTISAVVGKYMLPLPEEATDTMVSLPTQIGSMMGLLGGLLISNETADPLIPDAVLDLITIETEANLDMTVTIAIDNEAIDALALVFNPAASLDDEDDLDELVDEDDLDDLDDDEGELDPFFGILSNITSILDVDAKLSLTFGENELKGATFSLDLGLQESAKILLAMVLSGMTNGYYTFSSVDASIKMGYGFDFVYGDDVELHVLSDLEDYIYLPIDIEDEVDEYNVG